MSLELVGRILQIAGVLTVIFDLIGPVRLRRWGEFLRGPNGFFDSVYRFFRWINDLTERLDYWGILLILGMGIAFTTVFVLRDPELSEKPIWQLLPGGFVMTMEFGISLLIGGFFVVALLMTLALVLDLILIRPFAWAMSHRRLAWAMKALGVLMLLAGFVVEFAR